MVIGDDVLKRNVEWPPVFTNWSPEESVTVTVIEVLEIPEKLTVPKFVEPEQVGVELQFKVVACAPVLQRIVSVVPSTKRQRAFILRGLSWMIRNVTLLLVPLLQGIWVAVLLWNYKSWSYDFFRYVQYVNHRLQSLKGVYSLVTISRQVQAVKDEKRRRALLYPSNLKWMSWLQTRTDNKFLPIMKQKVRLILVP